MQVRVTFFLLLMLGGYQLYCQESILSQRVQLNLENVTLKEALNKLNSDLDVEISYSDDLIPATKKLTLSTEGSLDDVLKKVLSGTKVTFKQIGNQIVLISKKGSPNIGSYVIKGYVKDSITGEDLLGASVLVKGTQTGIITNSYGFYSLSLTEGEYEIIYSYLGYKKLSKKISLSSDITSNIRLTPDALQLNELVIVANEEQDIIDHISVGSEKLSANTIKQMPALLGEVDIIRSLLLLPGVQSVGEGKSGLFVRGGSADQTLIQLDEAIIFNAFHMGGIFSVFNPDALKDVKLYKGGIPVQYAGRLSSVLDVRMKEGNDRRISGSGGWGLISSRLTLEGPLFNPKNKSKVGKGSFIISGRRTYLDLLLKLSSDPEVNDNTLFFYDFNAKVNYTLNEKNRLFFSAYRGRDAFHYQDEFGLNWGNLTSTIRWNHLFNNKLFLNTTFLYSNFDNGFTLSESLQGITWDSSLKNFALKTDFYHYINPELELNYGYAIIFHHFSPAKIDPIRKREAFETLQLSKEDALEQGLYFSAKKQVTKKLEVGIGMRVSAFQNFGSGQFFKYKPNLPKTNENIIDTLDTSGLELVNSEWGLEPRISANYKLNESTSLKASYNRNKQYLFVLSTNNVGFPSDRYKPSDPNLKPQTSDQFSLGIFKNFKNILALSAEGYYKSMRNLSEIGNEPNALISSTLEQYLSVGKGWSYGLEFAIKKEKGNTTGWVSYTWSRTWNKFHELNGGRKFHPFYDRTHDFNIALSHKLGKRITLSTNWVYNSGQALSLPVGKYEIDGKTVARFDDNNLNGDRGPAYHRMDFAIELKGKNKKNRRWQGSWNFAFYNLYLRKNPIGFQFRDVINGDPEIEESNKNIVVESREFKSVGSYLFQFVPSITYNFKF